MEPSTGISSMEGEKVSSGTDEKGVGWRLDVADELPDNSSRNWQAVLAQDQEAVLMGKYGGCSNKGSYGGGNIWKELDV